METLYQSLVTVNPVTLIAQICNLFIQLLIVKIFFLDKIKAVIDRRREAADREISDAQAAKSEAAAIKQTYEQNMLQSRAKAEELLTTAQKSAAEHSEQILRQAQQQAQQMRAKASSDIELEKKKAINEAKNEISDLAMAIAGKVLERELNPADQSRLIDNFLNELGDGL